MEEQPVINNQIQQPPVNPVTPRPNYWLIAATVLIFIFVLSGIYTLFLKSQKQMSLLPHPTVSPTISQPSPTPNPTANWKTYTNTKYKYSFKYPPTWHIVSPDNLETVLIDQKCVYDSSDSSEVNIVSKKLETCHYWGLNPAEDYDISIVIMNPWGKTLYNQLNNLYETAQIITIDKGIKAVKNIFTDKSQRPRAAYTWIEFDYNNVGFRIFLKQDKGKQTYSPIYDQILSTFKFLKQSPSATCIPRPACLDAVPRCLMPESENMCPPKPTGNQVVCTQDAKQCPDGSYVSRQPPTCDFAACPQK